MAIVPSTFSSDRPLAGKSEDKLNRAPFAERVAEVLRGLPNGEGLIVGIHGPWGDGKTTVLNMLQADLDSDGATFTVHFNPWRFADEPAMLAGFFQMLAGVVRAKLTTQTEEVAAWLHKLGKVASVLDDRFGKAGELVGTHAEASLEELRSRLSQALAKSDHRIVVLVDDIDRLDKHETHTLFRLIKACADFPNVCYVLAFDDVAVARSLGERYGSGDEAAGRAFLEKIIQVPLTLPVAMREDLRSLCFEGIDQALSAAGIEMTQQDVSAFIVAFDRGLSIRLDTPRAAKRYVNALMFALPMLKDEVSIVDLLLLEAVRAFYPKIYEVLRANHAECSGVEPAHRRGPEGAARVSALLKPLVESSHAAEQEAIKSLLKALFPRLGLAFGGPGHGNEWLATWAKSKRVCSPDYCPRYFSYSVSRTDIRESDLMALYTKAANEPPAEVGQVIANHFSSGKAKRLIERMREREGSTPPEAVLALCLAIAANAKDVPNPPALLDFGAPVSQAAILISHLIRLLPAGRPRVTLAIRVVEAAEPLWFGSEVLRWLYVTEEADRAESNVLAKDEVDVVRRVLVERIKARAAAGAPLFDVSVRQEQRLLFDWRRADGREPVEAHLSSVFAREPANVELFLMGMAPRSWGQSAVAPDIGDLHSDILHNVDFIYELEALSYLIRRLFPDEIHNPERFSRYEPSDTTSLVKQFMYLCNRRNQDGQPLGTASDVQGD